MAGETAGRSTLGELRQEHASMTLGPLWLREIRRAVTSVIGSYPAMIYAQSHAWTAQAVDDMVQNVVVHQLLEQGQLDYILAVARDVGDVATLMKHRVRRELAANRTRGVIDNLLGRCREILREPLWRRSGADAMAHYQLRSSREARPPTEDELRAAAREVSTLTRVPMKSSERAPIVYRSDTLRELLRVVGSVLEGGFSQRDLDKIFSFVLTDHLPGALVFFDGSTDEPDRALTPEEAILVADVCRGAYDMLDSEERAILGMKLANTSDIEVARVVGLSRPTVAKRHETAASKLRSHVTDLPPHVQDAVLVALTGRLTAPFVSNGAS